MRMHHARLPLHDPHNMVAMNDTITTTTTKTKTRISASTLSSLLAQLPEDERANLIPAGAVMVDWIPHDVLEDEPSPAAI